MSPRFALGYKPDTGDYGYPSHRKLMSVAASLPTANHIEFRKGEIWQGPVGMCVGAAFKRCVQLWQEMNGFPSEFMISGKFAYDIGRVQEYAGMVPEEVPELVDEGSQPGLLLRGAHEVGVALDSDYPDPTSPSWNPAKVNVQPTIAECSKAFDGRGLEFSQITPGAFGFKEGIRSSMVRRRPVMFSMFVDTGFMWNVGAVITAIYSADPNGGGHMLGIVDASREDYVVIDNWWDRELLGIEWGMPAGNVLGLPRGTGRIAWALLERSIKQCFAVTAGPFVRRASAQVAQ